MDQNIAKYVSIALQTMGIVMFFIMLIFVNEIVALITLTGSVLLWTLFLMLSEAEFDKRNLGFVWITYGFTTSFVLLFTHAISEDMWGAILWNINALGLVLLILLVSLTIGLIIFYIHKLEEYLAQTHELMSELLNKLKETATEEIDESEL